MYTAIGPVAQASERVRTLGMASEELSLCFADLVRQPMVPPERMLPMTVFQFSDARVEPSGPMHDAGIADGTGPSAEELSRWENEGGAPASKKIVGASNEFRASDGLMLSRGDRVAPSLHEYVVSEPS